MEFGKQHLLWMVPVGIFFLACDGGIIGIIVLFFLYCYLAVKEEQHYYKEIERLSEQYAITDEKHKRAVEKMEAVMKYEAAMKNNTTDNNK